MSSVWFHFLTFSNNVLHSAPFTFIVANVFSLSFQQNYFDFVLFSQLQYLLFSCLGSPAQTKGRVKLKEEFMLDFYSTFQTQIGFSEACRCIWSV